MGKSSKKYPEYSGGSITINGKTVAKNSRYGNNINSSYDMSDTEKNIYDSVQKGLSSSLSNLFEITDPQRQEWTKQLNALKQTGIDNINNIYTPMETNLKNDIASRFGNFDNSVFLDSLNNITNKRAKAVSDLSNSLASIQNQLYSNEISNRLNVLSFLSGLNNSINNNILNYLSAASSNSAAGNSYNNSAFNTGNNLSAPWWGSMVNNAGNNAISTLSAITPLLFTL